MKELLEKIAVGGVLLALLPKSPFQAFLAVMEDIPYISVINWVIPIAEIIAVLQAWLLVVTVYCGYLIIIKWVNIVQG